MGEEHIVCPRLNLFVYLNLLLAILQLVWFGCGLLLELIWNVQCLDQQAQVPLLVFNNIVHSGLVCSLVVVWGADHRRGHSHNRRVSNQRAGGFPTKLASVFKEPTAEPHEDR